MVVVAKIEKEYVVDCSICYADEIDMDFTHWMPYKDLRYRLSDVPKKNILDAALPIEENEDGEVICPYCKQSIQDRYDCNNLDVYYSGPVSIQKDPCFCEASGSTTVYYKCPHLFCGGVFYEDIDWDY